MAHQASLIFKTSIAPKQGSKIPFGIHSNCKVTSIDFNPAEYLDINFEDSEGRFHNKRLWKPSGKFPAEVQLPDGTKRKETTAQALEREEALNLSHLIKLIHIFLGEAEIERFPALEYDAFIKRAINLLEPSLATKQVKLKLIYDTEGMYSTFGKFPDYIELHQEGKEPTLEFSNYEKSNRCTYKGKKTSDSAKAADTDVDELFK